jgi:hypothetical protein
MPQHAIVIAVGLAILNGMFSPALAVVFALNGIWYPFFMPAILPLVFMTSSLIVATLTLMIGGIPAALYERVFGGGKSDAVSGGIWVGTVALLTLPALPAIVKALTGA